MTIKTKLTINAVEFSDFKTLNVNRTIDESNAASSFEAVFDSPFGRHKSDFTVGQEVIIYADKDATPTTKIFCGVLEKVVFSGEETTQTCTLSGRDYTCRLMDLTVEPIVFSNQEVSTIVDNIMSNNGVQDITTTNVDVTSTTLKRIGFNHTPIFEALKQLAQLSGYIFYVDTDKDLHFELAENVSSGVTLDNTNVMSSDFDKSREGMANKIWVYGDRYLSEAPTEVYKFGSPVGLSGVTLNYKPHNTKVSYLGSVLKGSIQGMNILPVSGEQYGISFDDRSLVFYSGTSIGYNSIPASGGSVVVAYDRDLPIVKYGQNDNSILLYGPKVLKIQDNTIKDPQTATDILKQKLLDTDPLNRIRCEVRGWYTLTPGNLITFTMNDFNVNQDFQIVEINYKFDKYTIQTENILDLTISKKFIDITDKLKELKNRLDALETQNLQDTDILTRLFQSSTDSIYFKDLYTRLKLKSIGGDILIWGNSQYGLWGTQKWGTTAQISFVLSNPVAAILGTSTLGISSGATTSQDYYVTWNGSLVENFTDSLFISGLDGMTITGGSLVW